MAEKLMGKTRWQWKNWEKNGGKNCAKYWRTSNEKFIKKLKEKMKKKLKKCKGKIN